VLAHFFDGDPLGRLEPEDAVNEVLELGRDVVLRLERDEVGVDDVLRVFERQIAQHHAVQDHPHRPYID
jgi:hypothetical protein